MRRCTTRRSAASALGIGHYHGHEGFLEFSHQRTVFKAPAHDPRREWGLLPPYSDTS
jgi:coniferyl-aldehyde dehydrogenase